VNWRGRKTLGLAVTEQGLAAVVVSASADRSGRTGCGEVIGTAELAFTAELSLAQPEKLGKALADLLRRNNLVVTRCVIGLAANWIATRSRLVPTTDAESLRAALSLAVEREFAAGVADLAFDFLPAPSGTSNRSTLLVAAPRRVTDPLTAMARAAGLTVDAISCSPLALAMGSMSGPGAAPAGGRGSRLTLCLMPRGIELVVQSASGQVRLVRHLPILAGQANFSADQLAGELSRVLTTLTSDPGEQSADGPQGQAGGELVVWDMLGLDASVAGAIGQSLGMTVRIGRVEEDLRLTGLGVAAGNSKPTHAFSQAAALALVGDWISQPQAIDFLHSRLLPPSRSRFGRPALIGAAAGVVALAAILVAFFIWQSDQSAVTAIQTELASRKTEIERAKAVVDDLKLAEGWYDPTRPIYLDCLLEVTKAFPQEGRIWVTRLVIPDNGPVQIAGNALNEAAVLDLRDRLVAAKPTLSDVKLGPMRQASGTSNNVQFSITLTYQGAR
jgi:Tfp pilus assembly PilM family ATPase